MRVLVTGHSGYIGVVLVPMLLQAGHEVAGFDSELFARCTFGEAPLQVPSICKDIRDASLADLDGFDALLHLAGLSNDPLGDLNPDLTYEINHQASLRLARIAKEAGIHRFIFSSSCSNYGAAGEAMLNEGSDFNPVTPYGKSKVMVEQDVGELASDSFCPVFLRNATAYGLSSRLRFDLVLNNLVAWALTTGKIYLKSDGQSWRPMVHVEDISRAFLAVLEAPREKVHNRAFNIGRTEENYRIMDLAEIVAQVVPDCKLEFAPDASPDKRSYRVNCDLAQQTLSNFKPRWTVLEGARELFNAYKRLGLSPDEFEGPRYKRITHIRELMSQGLLGRDLRWIAQEQVNPLNDLNPV